MDSTAKVNERYEFPDGAIARVVEVDETGCTLHFEGSGVWVDGYGPFLCQIAKRIETKEATNV